MPFPNKDTQFKPGESGNPDGKPKGIRHLSTIIQELEADIDWDLTSLKSKDELSKKYGKNGMKALVMVAFSKAMSGDTKAMDWLAKYGYGHKLNLEVKEAPKPILGGTSVELHPNNGDQEAQETHQED